MRISPFAPADHELGDIGVLVVNSDGLNVLDSTQPDRPMTSARLSDLSESTQLRIARGEETVPRYPLYPDGVKWIERVLADSGMLVLARAAIGALTERQLATMYPDKQEKPWWPGLVAERIGKPVVGLLVGGRKGDDVIGRLQVLKGHDTDAPGNIRGTLSAFRSLPLDFYNRTGEYADPDVYAAKLAELARHDRVHAPDDPLTAYDTIATLFSTDQLVNVAKRYPTVSKLMALIIKHHMELPELIGPHLTILESAVNS